MNQNPSPFFAAREASNNLNNAFRRVSDENLLDSVLSNAMESGDPQIMQDTIGKILSQVSPERQGTAIQYLQNQMQNIQKKQSDFAKKQQEMKAAQEGGYTYGAHPTVQAAQVRNQQPPKTVGGISGQPIPQEISQTIAKVLEENKNANADELAIAMGNNGIPQAYSNSYIENRRRQDEQKNKSTIAEKKYSREEEIQFHKESQDYDNELLKQTKIAKDQIETVNNIDKILKSGNIKPSSMANVFKGFGKIGDKISEALLNEDEAALQGSIPTLLTGWKDVFGIRLTDADLKLLQDKLPSIGKSPEANRAILKILRKYADMTLLRNEIASQIKKDNKGLRPLNYASLVEERFDSMIKPVRIINPNNGNIIEIPAYKVSDAIKSGAKLADE